MMTLFELHMLVCNSLQTSSFQKLMMHHNFIAWSLLLAIFLNVKTLSFNFSQCDELGRYRVDSVSLDPEFPVPNSILNVTMTGIMSTMIYGGRAVMNFPGLHVQKDLCEQLDCPINEGKVTFPFFVEIPLAAALFSNKTISGRTIVFDEKNKELFCMELTDVLVAPPAEIPAAIQKLKTPGCSKNCTIPLFFRNKFLKPRAN